MRITLVALTLLAANHAAVAAPPTVDQLLQAWHQANTTCRGSSKPDDFTTMDECSRRDRLGGRLNQAGWCYGKKGQAGYQQEWHRCGPNSNQTDDLKPSN